VFDGCDPDELRVAGQDSNDEPESGNPLKNQSLAFARKTASCSELDRAVVIAA
jgi:hypothetical protein